MLALIHAFVLYRYGISTFITTCLYYYFVYILFKLIFSLIKNNKRLELVMVNLRNIILVLVTIEFIMTFIPPFTFLNNYMEVEKGVYFSEYKRKIQCSLLKKLGFEKARFVFEEGNLPNSVRILNRSEFVYKCSYNEMGLRGNLPGLHKLEDEIRVILLGDSFIEGDGTPDDSTISVLLEQKLNAENAGYRYTVINGGISGSNPIYEQQFFHKKLLQYNPDMIISSVYSNDLWDIQVMRHQNTMPAEEYFFAISHIFRLFYFGIMKNNDFSCLHPPESTKNRKKELLGYLQNDLIFSQKQLKNIGIDMLTMYIPSKEEVMHKNAFLDEGYHISSYIDYDINLLKLFNADGNQQKNKFINKYYWKNDAHFRPEGYNLVASILADKIRGMTIKKRNKTTADLTTQSK